MEVHHHPHIEKKSFKEYLLEGLMIFLAVSLGFIAENIRENINNHETEKKNMEVIVSNLKLDTANLAAIIQNTSSRSQALDCIELIRYQDLSDTTLLKSFFISFDRAHLFSYFIPSSAAFEQMKSSDGFKLVKNQEILDSLFGYYDYDKTNLELQTKYAQFFMDQVFSLEDKMFEPGRLLQTSKIIARNPDMMRELFNSLHNINVALKNFYTPSLQVQLQKASALIGLIKRKYNL